MRQMNNELCLRVEQMGYTFDVYTRRLPDLVGIVDSRIAPFAQFVS